MSEATANKEAALKLFGHTIQLLDDTSSHGKDEELHKDQCDDGKDEAEESLDHHPVQERRDNIKEWLPYNDCSTSKTSKSEEEQGETSNSQEKTLKKPDKIIPCPRCNSMETKFCYFNNYNMNQPRHFCKNCQRYWTAGGTMRNMPVGAGRRKHKNSVYHYRHISVPETDLTFDTHKPVSDSMVDNTSSRNGFHKYEELKNPDNGDDHSDISSVTAVSSKDSVTKGGPPDMLRQNGNSFPPHLQLFTGAPWPYPHGYYLPVPFYPTAPYWGCTIPGSWNVPWISLPQNQMPPTLGKHLRDENVMNSEPREESNSEKYLWFPKTLRIDDPGEAAKSSIWATLGIKHDAVDSVSGGGILKAFLPKSGENFPVSENSNVLQANPAAMSRSLNFNETS